MISPLALVAKLNAMGFGWELVLFNVCTPSKKVKAVGLTCVSGMFAPRGPANVTIAVTKSLVV
jgi:hypothetical protein